MTEACRSVRNRDLEPSWTVLRAREPGFQRSLITWMGGPQGYINTNPDIAVESRHCAVGLMDMAMGNRQPGVHTHTIDEIYVILEGQCESFDGVGNTHVAGPWDCLYIPKGVPHGVRTIGKQDLKLLWVNDAIERWGVSVYAEGPGPHPANDDVRLIARRDLGPAGSHAPTVHWVGCPQLGIDGTAGVTIANTRLALGMITLDAGRRIAEPVARSPQLWVIAGGQAIVTIDGRHERIGPQDAVFCPPGGNLDLHADAGQTVHLVRVDMAERCLASA